MKQIQVKLRNNFGRQASKKYRFLKQIPAVIYFNKNIKNIHILINESLLINISSYKKENILINFLNQPKEKQILVKIKEIQFHPFKNKLLHIDFLKI